MSVEYKCFYCHRRSKEPFKVADVWHPAKREVPGVVEADKCYISEHICPVCLSFYESYKHEAERQAALILYREEDPVKEYADAYEGGLPTNCDGAWNFIVQNDELSNEILDTLRVRWQENNGEPMTIGEVVKFIIQKEKEAAQVVDESVNENNESEVE